MPRKEEEESSDDSTSEGDDEDYLRETMTPLYKSAFPNSVQPEDLRSTVTDLSDDFETTDDDDDDEDDDSDDDSFANKSTDNSLPGLALSRGSNQSGAKSARSNSRAVERVPDAANKVMEKATSKRDILGLDASEHAIKSTSDKVAAVRKELDMSQHSLAQTQAKMNELTAHLDKEIANFSEDLEKADQVRKDLEKSNGRHRKSENAQVAVKLARNALEAKRDERAARLERARERIHRQQMEKEKEEQIKRLEAKYGTGKLDMSEEARRERAYAWYTRMAMPKRDEMKERVDIMPPSSGITVDDVDLLPWLASGSMVNTAKMMKMINEKYQKK